MASSTLPEGFVGYEPLPAKSSPSNLPQGFVGYEPLPPKQQSQSPEAPPTPPVSYDPRTLPEDSEDDTAGAFWSTPQQRKAAEGFNAALPPVPKVGPAAPVPPGAEWALGKNVTPHDYIKAALQNPSNPDHAKALGLANLPAYVAPPPPPQPKILLPGEEPAPTPSPLSIYRRQPGTETYTGPSGRQVDLAAKYDQPSATAEIAHFLLSPPRSVQDAANELNDMIGLGWFRMYKPVINAAAGLTSPAGIATAGAGFGIGAVAGGLAPSAQAIAAAKMADAAIMGYFAGDSGIRFATGQSPAELAQSTPEAYRDLRAGNFAGAAEKLAGKAPYIQAIRALANGDIPGALEQIGEAGVTGLFSYLAAARAHGQINDVATLAAAKKVLQANLNAQEFARAAAERTPPPPQAVPPQLPQAVPPQLGPAPTEQTPPTGAPEPAPGPAPGSIQKGSTFDTPDGQYRVTGLAGSRVIFEHYGPEGKRVGTMPMDQFRGTILPVASPAEAEQPPEAPAPPAIAPPVAAATPAVGPPPPPPLPPPGFTYEPLPETSYRHLPPAESAQPEPIEPPTKTSNPPLPTAPAPESRPKTEISDTPQFDYASTQANLSGPVAENVLAAGARIPDEQLAENGRETQPHVTVKYGLHDEDPEPVRQLLAGVPPIVAKLGPASIFETPNADVLKVSVEAPELHALNSKIADALPNTETHPEYQPHVTIAFLKPGEGEQYDGQSIPGVTGRKVQLNSIAFSNKDGQQVEIPLGKPGLNVPESPSDASAVPPPASLPADEQTTRSSVPTSPVAQATVETGQAPPSQYLTEDTNQPQPANAPTSSSNNLQQQYDDALARAEQFKNDAKAIKGMSKAKATLLDSAMGALKEAQRIRAQMEVSPTTTRMVRAHVDDIIRTMTALENAVKHTPSSAFVELERLSRLIASGKEYAAKLPLSEGEKKALESTITAAQQAIGRSLIQPPVEAPAPTAIALSTPSPDLTSAEPPNTRGPQETVAKAAEIFQAMNSSERTGVKFGLFPAGIMRAAEAEGFNHHDLSVALMDAAKPIAHEPPPGAPTSRQQTSATESTIEPEPSYGGDHPPIETRPAGSPNTRPPAEVSPQDVSGVREAGEPAINRPEPGEPGQGVALPGDSEGAGLPGGVGTGPRDLLPAGRGRRAEPAEQPAVSHDYRITPEDLLGAGGEKAKATQNIEAIRTLKKIEEEGREATPEEQRTLVKYVGWGQFAQQLFGYYRSEWAGLKEELENLLTPEEWEAARKSTTNAHYTSPDVVNGMWGAMKHLGYQPDSRMLEPGAGIGHFLGLMPEEFLPAGRTAVEMDSITGRITQLLYPSANVQVKPFEKTSLPNDYFDLAIGNVPFGNFGVHDAAYRRNPLVTRSLHDFFFAKSLDKVRPGGIVAFVTSAFTMDKMDPAMRNYLASKADLLGAVRLPGGKRGAFARNAGTEVTTDIIFLQKRPPQTPAVGEKWADLAPVPGTDENGRAKEIQVNEYFARHPEMMLGKMALEGRMYGPDKSKVLIGELTPERLAAAVAKLPANSYKPLAPEEADVFERNPLYQLPNAGELKDGGFGVKDGMVIVREGDQYKPADLTAEQAQRVKGMLPIRDAIREVFRTQLNDAPENEVAAARAELNKAYDRYVKMPIKTAKGGVKAGPLNSPDNLKAMAGDPDAPLLASLEEYDAATKTAFKREIFSKRTLQKYVPITKVDRASEALSVSLAELGRIDWSRMQDLTGKTPEAMREELGPMVFRNPEGHKWETNDEYLSGFVRDKLQKAEEAAKTDAQYERNVEALRVIQPKDLTPGQINARLGASWLPTGDIKNFIGELLDVGSWSLENIRVSHAGVLGHWSVAVGDQVKSLAANTNKWGTPDYAAHELIEDALNLKIPTVYRWEKDENGGDKRVVDKPATLAAQDKQGQIREEFRKWLWADVDRAARLARQYNDEFNNMRLREYDGSHLTFPGMAKIGLRTGDLDPHQKNAVWRVIQNGNTLLAHVVGAGKTFEMIAAGMEMKRLGLVKKPIYVVPNHLVEQWGGDFLRLYPSANIFVAGKEHFSTGNRQKAMSRIATGNYDAVIVSHRSFQFLPVSDETFTQFVHEQMHDIDAALEEARRADAESGGGGRGGKSGKSRSVKELEKARARLEKQLADRANREESDKTIDFEQTGADQIFVDEADLFKNLYYATKMTRVAGLPNSNSNRAMDMFIKSQYLTRLNNGRRGVVFATGTPIANTLAEMFTMQRYLQMEYLKQTGQQSFDSWVNNFAEPVTGLELAPEGETYRMNTRMAKFINLPELLTAFRSFADVKNAEDLNLPKPTLKTGKPIIISVPGGDELRAFVKGLGARAESIRHGLDPRIDNMLKVVGEGRKAALDMRLVAPGLRDNPNSKINIAVGKIASTWRETVPQRSTQLVFLDLGTPRGSDAKETKEGELAAQPQPEDDQAVSVYRDIKNKLVRAGVPANDIRFIHDAKDDAAKQRLYNDMNAGRVRILLGSTEKMGAGMNVQRKIIALHHLDVPWRPRDIGQRNGRAERQGNENPEISIYHYVTEGSFDAYMWQTILAKASMIAQAMSGDLSVREIEDVGVMQMSAAEAMAASSGNPEIRERIGVQMELRKLESLKEAHANTVRAAAMEVRNLPRQIESEQRYIADEQAVVAKRNAWPTDQEPWRLAIGRPKDSTERNKMLWTAALKMAGTRENLPLGTYKGFPVVAVGKGVSSYAEGGKIKTEARWPDIEVNGHTAYSVWDAEPTKAPQLALGVQREVDVNPDTRISVANNTLQKYQGRLRDLQSELTKGFGHEDRLNYLRGRLKELDTKLEINKTDPGLVAGPDGELAEGKDIAPTTKADAGPIADYQKGQGKLAAPAQGWWEAEVDGKTYHTDGKSIFEGKAPGKVESTKPAALQQSIRNYIRNYLEVTTTPVRAVAYSPIVPGEKDQAIWFSNGLAIPAKSYDYALRNFPEATFAESSLERKPISVLSGATTVGVVMPLQNMTPPPGIADLLNAPPTLQSRLTPDRAAAPAPSITPDVEAAVFSRPYLKDALVNPKDGPPIGWKKFLTPWKRYLTPAEADAYYNAAKAEGRTVSGQPVLWVNNAGFDIVAGRISGPDLASSVAGGVALVPEEWKELLQSADEARRSPLTPSTAALVRIADALQQVLPRDHQGGVVVVQTDAYQNSGELKQTLQHELDHLAQMALPEGLHGLPSDMLDTPVGKSAQKMLVSDGYKQPNPRSQWFEYEKAVMTAEVIVRLMRPGQYKQLGLSAQEARDLARQFIMRLIEDHGDKAVAVVDRIYETLESLGERRTPPDESQLAPSNPSLRAGGHRGRGELPRPDVSRYQPLFNRGSFYWPNLAREVEGLTPAEALAQYAAKYADIVRGIQGRPGIAQNAADLTDQLHAERDGEALQSVLTSAFRDAAAHSGLWPAEITPAEPLDTTPGPERAALSKKYPELARAGSALTALSNELKALLAPAAIEGAAPAALSVRKRAAEQARQAARAEAALEFASKALMKLPESVRWDFYDRVETGQEEPDPGLREIATAFRSLLDQARKAVVNLGTGKLESFIKNYLPHIYKDAKRAEQIIGQYYAKRPFEGQKGFLKQRTFETLKEGMAAGLEPVSDNPVDMVLLKLREMYQYVTAHQVLKDGQEQGWLTYVPAAQRAPQGMQRIDDRVATVFGPPAVSVRETFDQNVTTRLNTLAESLGIEVDRKPFIGGSRAGFTTEGSNRVTTRSFSPDSVLAHEIGHQLEWKYNLSGLLKNRDYGTKGTRERELRALADLRYQGQEDVTQSFKQYVREKDEKMANAVAALVYAPELFRQTAPETWDFLRDELWHIPQLRPLFDVKPSMVLGERRVEVPIAGIRIMGQYWAPEAAARVVNNYLSPSLRSTSAIFRGYLGMANAMNQFNLGFSAFHLGFTTVDAMVSKMALGIYQAAHGHPIQGIVSAIQFPIAPFTGIVRGDKILREYYQPGSQGAQIATTVDAMIEAGGRAKMDAFYRGAVTANMQQAFRKGGVGYLTGALRIPFVLAEQASKPILEWIVPRQKMAVFADLAEFELQRMGEGRLAPEDVQAALARAWDSVDNRMGQLVYDNLFWDKLVKDLLMASVRTVGWNTGTIREILGGAADVSRVLNCKPDVSSRLSYLLALPFTVAILGAVYFYLKTGQRPETVRDYYLPRSGPPGTAEWNRRVELPSYVKDIMSASSQGIWKTAKGKLHPFLTMCADMLANTDFYGDQIRNPNDPITKQIRDSVIFALEGYEPISIKQPAAGKIPETPGERAERMVGITQAPKYLQEQKGSHRKVRQHLPRFGDGGTVTEPTRAVVGDKGPEAIVDLAAGKLPASGEDIIRGSSDIPLAPVGIEEAKHTGARLAAKGGVDRIVSSDLTRAKQTATAIQEATGAPYHYAGENWSPWRLGEIEGQPTKQALETMTRYMLKKPDVAAPGRGEQSTHDGESFNSFKRRCLGAVKTLLDELRANPEERVCVVTHYRDIKLIESWVRKGAPPSLEIDVKHMTSKGDPPASVERLFLNSSGKPAIEPVNLKSDAVLKPGVYVVRHGATPWNAEAHTKVVTKPTVVTLAKDGPQQVIPLKPVI